MKEYIDRAIILKIAPYADNDAMLVVFTERFGKITLVGRGLFKPHSKNNPLCRVGSVVGIEFFLPTAHAEIGKMKTLHYDISFLSEDLLEQSSVLMCCEVLYAFLPAHHQENLVFYEYLFFIQKKTYTPFFAIVFCIKLSSLLGMLPNFLEAKKYSTDRPFFWTERGITTLCPIDGVYISLSFATIKIFHTACTVLLSDFPLIDISESQWNELWKVWWQFFSWHVSWAPKSKKIIEEIM